MTTTILKPGLTAVLLSLFVSIQAQETRAFNQNASRSNHTRLSFSFSPVYSTPLGNNTDSLLFRGSGTGFRLGADYFFGNIGIGFSSGFGSSSTDDAAVNNFLKRSGVGVDQPVITKSKQQNTYLLIGPAVKFGKEISIEAHARAGLFINNAGLLNIQQRGAQRAIYRNEPVNSNTYPGFLTGIKAAYTTQSGSWSFGVGADYLATKTAVNNYDARRGGGIEPLELKGKVNDLVAGVSVSYHLFSGRDAASGMATGKRSREAGSGLATGRRSATPRDAASGMATGRRSATPRDAASGLATGRRSYQPVINTNPGTENCGTVKQTTTLPDGSVQENTFACPADAAAYTRAISTAGLPQHRLSMNVTTPRQTQGSSFGEKVNAGLHAAGANRLVHRDIAARGTIAGKLSWSADNSYGIGTNKTAATGKQTASPDFGMVTKLAARDAQSGQATGKRSREAGSGMATGRRQYQLVFDEAQNNAVSNPLYSETHGSVSNPLFQGLSTNNNPLYEAGGNAGVNPLHEGLATGGEGGGVTNNPLFEGKSAPITCDGLSGVPVSLVDIASGTIIATTRTETCGEFFFTNVPGGNYIVQLEGIVTMQKGYDYTAASKIDVAGVVSEGTGHVNLQLFTTTDSAATLRTLSFTNTKSGIQKMIPAQPVVPTGTIAARTAGTPIGGIIVKGGKNPGGLMMTTPTGEDGSFAFDGLDAGKYIFIVERNLALYDETVLSIGKPAEEATNAPVVKAQNNNTVRSNRGELKSISVEADTDGDGVYETDVTTELKEEGVLDENGNVFVPQQKAGISTSRSNVRTRSSLQPIGNDLYIGLGTAMVNGKQVPVRTVYKTRHDTAKNSINNVR